MATTQSPRAAALQNLSKQMPVANSRIATQQQAGRDIQLQQAVQKAPPQQNIATAAQETGAAIAANAGQQMVQNAAAQIKQQGQLGTIGLQEEQDQLQQGQATARLGARESSLNNVSKLAALDERAKSELYDKQIQFDKDEAGRTLFNERQLADYAKSSAISDEQAANYGQLIDQNSKRKLQLMETAYNKVVEDMTQKYAVAKQNGDQQTQLEIVNLKRAMEERIRDEKNAAANKAARNGAIGTIGGSIAGGLLGGASGAQAGGAIGGGIAKAFG